MLNAAPGACTLVPWICRSEDRVDQNSFVEMGAERLEHFQESEESGGNGIDGIF